jgi:putative spermidine/putrescine transport system substrate-binding protein
MKPDLAVICVPLCVTALLSSCGGSNSQHTPPMTPAEFASMQWQDVVRKARGTEVGFAMWAGDEAHNHFFRNEARKKLVDEYGIALRIVPLNDTVEAVNKLLNERSVGKISDGSIDVVWINGENFRSAKQGGVLWGPFSGRLPNIQLYDERARERDFVTPIEGLEAPWQKAQFVMAYDTARVPKPPDSIELLKAWIKVHPGRFTYIAPPDFTGSVFIRHLLIHLAHRDPGFWNGFSENLYQRASLAAIEYLNELKPFLWRRGETYPPTAKELDRLFANNEVDFAMSYSPAFASIAIARGEFPATARTFAFQEGTIGNYSFLAIPFNANNPAGALVTINSLISFEQMLQLSRAFDSQFPHRLDRLTDQQRSLVEALPRGPATLPLSELAAHFVPEPDAEYLNRFEKDWSEKVLRK